MNNKRLEELLANESFVLWVKNECSAEEEEYWDSWLREDSKHRILVREANEIISAMNNEYEAPNPYRELDKLNRSIDQSEDYTNDFHYQKNNRSYQRSMMSVAAGIVFMVVILGGVFAYQIYPLTTNTTENSDVVKTPIKKYDTDFGEKLTLKLSDGSNIILNANSSLKFSSEIENGLNTEVRLKGEAYFDITHLEGDQQRTFTVHTENGTIQVLGTRFAVNTFRDQTRAVLVDGKINLRVKSKNLGEQSEYMLEPGEMARFRAYDNKIAIKKVNTQIYTSWMEDKFIFESTPLRELAKRIENTFGIEVVVGEAIISENISGSIRSDSLEVLTESLKKILKTNIEHRKDKLYIGVKR